MRMPNFQIPKRRFRKTLNNIFFLSIIFLITLGILLLFYISSSIKKHLVLSPISLQSNTNKSVSAGNSGILKSMLQKQNIDVTDITSSSDSSTMVILKNKGEVLFSDKKDLSEQIASLQLIIRRLTIEGRQFK